MTEGTVVRLAKSQGDEITQGEVIAEIETEKLNYDLESVAGGKFHPIVGEGATVAVDGLIGYVLAEGEEAPAAESPSAPSATASTRRAQSRRPSAQRGGGGSVRSTPRRQTSRGQPQRRSVAGHTHRSRRPGCRSRCPRIRGTAGGQTGRSPFHSRRAPPCLQPRRRYVAGYRKRTQRPGCRSRRSRLR